jgi:hypothetical protein
MHLQKIFVQYHCLKLYYPDQETHGKANEIIGNTAIEAVIGGTISVVGGGKFANGAQTPVAM